MEITNLLVDSAWHSADFGTIQIRSVDLDTNEVTYITIENLDHAYDDTREMITESFDAVQAKWTISDYDADRIAAGLTNADLTPPIE